MDLIEVARQCPDLTGHLPSNQKQDVRSSDKVLRSRQFSFSKLDENRVTSDMPRAHIHIYVFVRFRVHILTYKNIRIFTYKYAFMSLYIYAVMHL